nr:ORF I polyprotein [Ipomoea batatas]
MLQPSSERRKVEGASLLEQRCRTEEGAPPTSAAAVATRPNVRGSRRGPPRHDALPLTKAAALLAGRRSGTWTPWPIMWRRDGWDPIAWHRSCRSLLVGQTSVRREREEGNAESRLRCSSSFTASREAGESSYMVLRRREKNDDRRREKNDDRRRGLLADRVIVPPSVQDWPEELNWIFWYLCHEYHILMEFHRPSLRKELDLSVEKDLIKFLTWFYPLKYWKKLCQDGPEFFTVHLHREVTAWVSRFLEGHAEPFMKIYEQHMESIIVREEDYPEFQRYIFAQNKVIPKEIWPREGIQPDVRQDDEIYYERIKSAKNQYYYELSQVKKGEDIWSQDPWNFDDIDSVLEEVEKIEKAYAQKSRKKRPKDKSQWNKDVWRTKRRQSGMDRQEWVNYMGYPSYSTESDTASDEDSVMDLQFRGEWMIMKAS